MMASAAKNMYKHCETCKNRLQSFCISTQCVNCCNHYHANCVNMKREEIENHEMWYCSYCLQSIFPINHMDDVADFNSAVLEGLLNFAFDFHEMNSKVFIPFEISESIDTPLTEMDPDIQYYSNSNYYYLEDQFISKVAEQKNCNRLSFFHLNVKSIPNCFDELEMYINSLKLEFTMIALTETWLDQSKQDLYNIPKYNCINRFRKQRRVGGVSLYIKNDIKFINRPDLEYFDAEMESLFI